MERNTILHGDALSVLQTLPDACVQCCVTSPPYLGLRDYGAEGQIGLEETPAAYVEKLVQVFREVRRVLRSDGTCWINLGDSYAHDGKWGGSTGGKHVQALHGANETRARRTTGLPAKNLMMIPARVAIALQDDGWILRSDIIWSKPTAMPEPVIDRPASAHEHIFLLAKSGHYYYDADAVRRPLKPKTYTTFGIKHRPQGNDALGRVKSDNWGKSLEVRKPRLDEDGEIAGAHLRNVWEVASQPFPDAHFATFPPKLIEPAVLAGTSPQACEHCSAPWKRITQKTEPIKMAGPNHTKSIRAQEQMSPTGKTSMLRSGCVQGRKTTGWEPTCNCTGNTGGGKCVILDPFMGAGTSALVALQLGRDFLGIELNEEYVDLAKKRIAVVQPRLFTAGEGVA